MKTVLIIGAGQFGIHIAKRMEQLDCEIMDNIGIQLEGDIPQNWVDYICDETRSKVTEVASPDLTLDVEFDDSRKVTVKISK